MKGRPPRKRKKADEEPQRETQPKGELLPPVRVPPTAVATGSTQPPREPVNAPAHHVHTQRPIVLELIETLRTAVGAMMDIADAAAEVITKRLEGRA